MSFVLFVRVSPRMRRVDWNSVVCLVLLSKLVSPRMRRVDWNWCAAVILHLPACLSSHEESGLKYKMAAQSESLSEVSPRMRRVDWNIKFSNKSAYSQVSPRMRRVDWNIQHCRDSKDNSVSPRMRRVDWNFENKAIKRLRQVSPTFLYWLLHSSHEESGLKFENCIYLYYLYCL